MPKPSWISESDDRLAGVRLLTSLTQSERHELASRCRWRRVRAQEEVIRSGSDDHDAYFIIEGRVRVVDCWQVGREISFQDLGAGECFGELSAIDGQPRSASVVALVDTLLAGLPSRSFLDLLGKSPEVALVLMSRLARMVRQANERVMNITALGARNRVYSELLRLARATVQENNSAVVNPAASHGEIASRISTTRETVARVLSELSKLAIVRRRNDALVIHDLQRLVDLAKEVKKVRAGQRAWVDAVTFPPIKTS